jgi:rRNA maturation RNase YbeY
MQVQFFFADSKIAIKERKRLKVFIPAIFIKEGSILNSINYIFCSDEYLLNINREFLQHDYYTDIITFKLSQSKLPIDAEIYISIDRVKDNAKLLHETIGLELHRVIFHGVLHLCGYRDKTKNEIEIMRKAENKYLRMYFK